jgi:hypothetical protein
MQINFKIDLSNKIVYDSYNTVFNAFIKIDSILVS